MEESTLFRDLLDALPNGIMAFDLDGEIYTDPAAPEVVYLWIESDLLKHLSYWKGGSFVRFITEHMRHQGSGEIFLFGKRYSCIEHLNHYGWVKTLPDGYESVGMLSYIGEDYRPTEHLETNYFEAQFKKSEVFYSEAFPEKIYISVEIKSIEKQMVYIPAVLLEEDAN